jgi:putative protease
MRRIKMKKVELLAPAGNLEKMINAFHFGADAVYMGGSRYNLRAFADNFTDDELIEAVDYAHSIEKKVYITLNIIAHNEDLENMADYIKFLDKINIDGVIVSDLGVFQMVKENSNIPISVSTQASNTNWMSVKMWRDFGAKRVILARELSLDEIKEIKTKVPDVEIEVFVHGAMCISISGRCLLSNYMADRDANRGECAHPCRWKYHLVEEKRPNEYFPISQDERGTYIMNSKDLCTIEFIDKIIDSGVSSLKIEGRMKGIYYGAVTTKIYRQAIDSYYQNFNFNPLWLEELGTISHRNYTSGFYFNKADENSQNYSTSSYTHTHKLVGKIIEIKEDYAIVEVRNQLNTGDVVEILRGNKNNLEYVIPEMINYKTLEKIETANPNHFIKIKLNEDVKINDLLRKKYNS